MAKIGAHVGALRNLLTIQREKKTADSHGGNLVSWEDFGKAWGKIEPMSANQILWAGHLEHRITHKITIRFLHGVTSDMRISYYEKVFQIKGIRNIDELNKWQELTCEEGSAS